MNLTCDDYLETLWNSGRLATIISEQYWSGGVDTRELFDYLETCARKDGVELIDRETWEYDKPLYECYVNDSDKGLS